MKRDFRPQNSGFRLSAVLFGCLAVGSLSSLALNEGNPYAAIGGRNVFALKPPPPPSTVNDPAKNTPPPNLELQGFTTILGRPQVLIKLKIPPRPPEPAKDRSLVMDVGQREGDVEVMEMDAYAGTVKLKNMGAIVSLNLKDNASKPTAGPALPAPVQPAAPGLPAPVRPAVPTPSGASVTTVGASGTALPTRSIRQNQSAPMTAEHQAVLMEVERERTKDLVKQGKYPPLPPLPGVTPQPEE